MTLASHLKSAISLVVITLNLAFWIALALPIRLARSVVPPLAPAVHRAQGAIYRAAVRVDDFWLRRVIGLRWPLPQIALDAGRTHVVLANHVSWADIFLIQSLLVSHGLVVKFLTKRELLALPIVGLILWTFEFPLLRRTSRRGESEAERKRRDFEALREACRDARENPVALVCFAEGTRATAERRASRGSPHRHLLPPRVGGFDALCDGLGDALGGVVDCTIVYPSGPRPMTFWAFLSGGHRPARSADGASPQPHGTATDRASAIGLHAERIAPGEIPDSRAGRARWLEERWAIKDARIAEALASMPSSE